MEHFSLSTAIDYTLEHITLLSHHMVESSSHTCIHFFFERMILHIITHKYLFNILDACPLAARDKGGSAISVFVLA